MVSKRSTSHECKFELVIVVWFMIARSSAFVITINSSRAKIGEIEASLPRTVARPMTVHGHARIRSLIINACADAVLDQDSTPLVDRLAEVASNVRSPLFYPGHKMGSGAPERFVDNLLGGSVDAFRHDLPELPELDNLFAPEGPIRDAELLAAEAFGATKTWFLANGSTCGVIASILACVQWHNSPTSQRSDGSVSGRKGSMVREGQEDRRATTQRKSVVIMPRDAHKSAVHALVLSGANPCFLTPVRHPVSGISLGIGRRALEAALTEHGDEVAAVFLVSPTYEGVCADVASAAMVCHAAGVPLVVDEAHGGHLAFLEAKDDEQSPRGALQSGADLVIQSAHKTLGSLTQSAYLHLGKETLSDIESECTDAFSTKRAISDALALVQSSSPNYLLLASLDAARWSLTGKQGKGKSRLHAAVQLVRSVKKEIGDIEGVHMLELGGEHGNEAGFVGMDPLRLTVSFEGGLGGYEADEMLIEEFGVYAELPAPGAITFVFGPGSTPDHGQVLITALRHIGRKASNRKLPALDIGITLKSIRPQGETAIPPKQICTPREAYFAPSKTVSAREAIGMASAETVCPYPPGIPALLPGEGITQESLDILEAAKAGGGMVLGCSDPSLATMRVVDSHFPSA